jgi:LysM repeat protein
MRPFIATFIAIYFCSMALFAQQPTEVVRHTVTAGQTLFFISKLYNVSIDDIRKNNPSIGDDLIIRPDDELIIKAPVAAKSLPGTTYETHTVQTKETLYSISKKYNVPVDEIIRLNNLETPAIQIGQELKIRALNVNKDAIFTAEKVEKKATETPKPAQPAVAQATTPVEAVKVKEPAVAVSEQKTVGSADKTDSQLLKLLYQSYEAAGNTLKKDKGIANFLQQEEKNVYLALVNGVPAGEVIRVRNLMNNKVVYLKVLGPLPAKDADKNVGLKISKAAADDLNVIEEKFLAEWSWFEVKAEKKLNTEGMQFSDF